MPYYFNQSLIILCLASFWGALVYRLDALDNLGVFLSLLLVGASYWIIYKNRGRREYENNNNFFEKLTIEQYNNRTITYFLLPCFFLFFACFFVLTRASTGESIISPWQAVPDYFFFAYAALTILLVYLAKKNIADWIYLVFLNFYFFLSFSIAVIIYKLGYGFDPFIHEATLNLIDQKGQVLPKPFYYLGQYSLEIIIHKISGMPLAWLNKLLVPLLAAIYLPWAIHEAIKKYTENKTSRRLAVLASLIFPFSFFIITTPQNLAYLFLILIILISLNLKQESAKTQKQILIWLLSLCALVAQPIAGIPALFFVSALSINFLNIKQKIKKLIYLIIFLLAVFSLPLAFYLFSQSVPANENNSLISENNISFLKNISSGIPVKENAILNFVYLYGFNLKFAVLFLALAGMAIAIKDKKKLYLFYLFSSLALFFSYLIALNLSFNFLIYYERGDYAGRILSVSGLFLIPFLLLAISDIIKRAGRQNIFFKVSLAIFLSLLIVASLYLSYPRHDHYFNSRGYSTSEFDAKAVNWIENDAKNDYIVLANQQVSAAALREFGFKKYYKSSDGEDIFYYPIPTGGALYQYYLKMVYEKPEKNTVIEAMELAQVDTAYFVLNKYWRAFRKILDEAKLEADSFEKISNGEVYVFKYIK